MNFPISLLQDILFTSDKIYSVLAVVLVVFGAFLFMMIRQDRRLSQMESEMNEKDNPHP
ncbi:MAG: CcmD family protein [Bacteroidota bacterium]